MAAIGAFAAIGFLHHLVSGPNRVSAEDEENAKRLTGREK
jgi:formate dehydrogenase iron-sulfur subunit